MLSGLLVLLLIMVVCDDTVHAAFVISELPDALVLPIGSGLTKVAELDNVV